MSDRPLVDDLAFEERLEAGIQSQTRMLRQQVADLSAEAVELQRQLGLYDRLHGAKIAVPRWTHKPGKAGHAGIVVAQLTDTHFDEVVRPDEVLGLNAYGRDIAQLRLRRWAEKVVALPREYMTKIRLEGLVVLATGDLLSGDIHAELKQSNEDHLYASALHWIEQLLAALDLLEREYGALHIAAVVGNHGRSTIKPVFKGRAKSNIEWLVWSVLRGRLADRGSKITLAVSDAMDLNVPIYGRNHLITHGDQFHGGTGISGAYAPLSLGQHRKSVRQMAAEMPMELMVMGHFHQLLDLPGLVVGGSMKGYDEYAFGLNLRPEEAGQMLWITTPERGKTMTMPVMLQDRVAEGW
jgi:hypothetical protein